MKICIIIPIKHNSERVPGKNYRDFNGKPLFHIILNTLLKSKYINQIYVDTNSPIVMESIKTVKNVKEAINHILKYGTMHTDGIISESAKNTKIFLEGVNSSIAMHNTSNSIRRWRRIWFWRRNRNFYK